MKEYIIKGVVVCGKQLGRTIGFPTANLNVNEEIHCPSGVYFALCEVDGVTYRVILNIGSHPTVPEGAPTVEAHLIDYCGDLYGRILCIRLMEFLRKETRFESLAALQAQLERDKQRACLLPVKEN